MNNLLRTLMVLLLLGFGLVACEPNEAENAAESAGQAVEDAVQGTGEALENAADNVGDAAEDAAQETEDAAEDATDGQ